MEMVFIPDNRMSCYSFDAYPRARVTLGNEMSVGFPDIATQNDVGSSRQGWPAALSEELECSV